MPGLKAIHERFGAVRWSRLCEDAIAWVRTMFAARGLQVTECDPEEHDRHMAVVQVLTHFATEVMGRCLADLGIPFEQTRRRVNG